MFDNVTQYLFTRVVSPMQDVTVSIDVDMPFVATIGCRQNTKPPTAMGKAVLVHSFADPCPIKMMRCQQRTPQDIIPQITNMASRPTKNSDEDGLRGEFLTRILDVPASEYPCKQ
ncbi:hypothetical protein DPSP01_013432 [Paraphaeosphaeria sporulosa]